MAVRQGYQDIGKRNKEPALRRGCVRYMTIEWCHKIVSCVTMARAEFNVEDCASLWKHKQRVRASFLILTRSRYQGNFEYKKSQLSLYQDIRRYEHKKSSISAWTHALIASRLLVGHHGAKVDYVVIKFNYLFIFHSRQRDCYPSLGLA